MSTDVWDHPGWRSTRYQQILARATVFNSVGQLPAFGDKPIIVRARPVRARVLSAGFFFEHRIPEVGEILKMDSDDAVGLQQRGLVTIL